MIVHRLGQGGLLLLEWDVWLVRHSIGMVCSLVINTWWCFSKDNFSTVKFLSLWLFLFADQPEEHTPGKYRTEYQLTFFWLDWPRIRENRFAGVPEATWQLWVLNIQPPRALYWGHLKHRPNSDSFSCGFGLQTIRLLSNYSITLLWISHHSINEFLCGSSSPSAEQPI